MSSGTPAGGIADGRDGASVPSRRSATPRVPRPGPAARSLLDEHRLKEVVLKSERPGHLASTVRAMALRERGPSAFCMAKGSAAAVLLHWLLGQQVNRDSIGVQRTSKIVDGRTDGTKSPGSGQSLASRCGLLVWESLGQTFVCFGGRTMVEGR